MGDFLSSAFRQVSLCEPSRKIVLTFANAVSALWMPPIRPEALKGAALRDTFDKGTVMSGLLWIYVYLVNPKHFVSKGCCVPDPQMTAAGRIIC